MMKLLLTMHQSEEEAGLCLYDSLENFAKTWKAGEYEPECTFCLAPDNVDVVEVIQEEKQSTGKGTNADGKDGVGLDLSNYD